MTGEQEDQMETMNFLMVAMLAAVGLIFMIMVTQFNSVGRAFVIFLEILFSIIGVFLGFAIFGMDISIVMTGVGIMALAGIVARNGIVLVEFTDLLVMQGVPMNEAVVEAGRTRMTPVLLTAIAAILGLIPLAVGLNIDFWKMFDELNPHLFFGGDNVAFWGPLAWTIALSISYAVVMFTMPAIGAWADQHAAKKRLLMLSTAACVLATAALALTPGMAGTAGGAGMTDMFGAVVDNVEFGRSESGDEPIAHAHHAVHGNTLRNGFTATRA